MAGKKSGEYAYLLALIVAVLAGIAVAAGALTVVTSSWIALLLVILGVVVGLLNISEKETTAFLVAALALLVTGTSAVFSPLNVIPGLGTLLDAIVLNLAIFAAPAAVITAVKAVHAMASKK